MLWCQAKHTGKILLSEEILQSICITETFQIAGNVVYFNINSIFNIKNKLFIHQISFNSFIQNLSRKFKIIFTNA